MDSSRLSVQLLPQNGRPGHFPGLWLGTWKLGGIGFGFQDLSDSLNTLEAAYCRGIRYFDTAYFYAKGQSNRILKDFIKTVPRESLFISSKVGLIWNGNNVSHNASVLHIEQSIQVELDSLGLDYLDLYSLHWPDPKTPINASIQALQKLQSKKLIKRWGICNFTQEQVLKYIPEKQAVAHQINFNPIHQSNDILHVSSTHKRCINCVYSPFEQGLLSRSNISKGINLGKKDFRRRLQSFFNSDILDFVNKFHYLCEQKKVFPEPVILLWLLQNSLIDHIIFGARTVQQLNNSLSFEIFENTLNTSELFAFLNQGLE